MPEINPYEPPQSLEPRHVPQQPRRRLRQYAPLIAMGLVAQVLCLGFYLYTKPTIWHQGELNENALFFHGCLIVCCVMTTLLNLWLSISTGTRWLHWLQVLLALAVLGTIVVTLGSPAREVGPLF